jgi:hypothetical protein
MINRVVTLIEDAKGTPLLSQFEGADHVSPQDGVMYIVYYPPKNLRYRHGVILWRQGPGLYAAFGSSSLINKLGTFKNMIAYCNQTTHAWRCFLCSGTDTSLPAGQQAVVDRYVRTTVQPPKPISPGQPWVQGTFSITSIKPTVASTCGPINLVENAVAVSDPADLPIELTLTQQIMVDGFDVESGGEKVVVG